MCTREEAPPSANGHDRPGSSTASHMCVCVEPGHIVEMQKARDDAKNWAHDDRRWDDYKDVWGIG